MDQEFPYGPPKKRYKHRSHKRRPGAKAIRATWLWRNRRKREGFSVIIKNGDRVLFTRTLRITRVVVYDTLHRNRVVGRGPDAYLEVQKGHYSNNFAVAGAGSVVEDGWRLYFRCKYKAYKVKVWLRRPPVYVWPWLAVE